MAYTTVDKSSSNFKAKTYTGSGSAQALTGVGFQPDWIWIKNRGYSDHNKLVDRVRWVSSSNSAQISSNQDSAAGTQGIITSFDSDGFTLTTGDRGWNSSDADNFISWNWKANGQGSSNTDGTINTTYTSANTASGFSICQWTGTGSAATIGHGLGSIPKVILMKKLSGSAGWVVYHHSIGAGKYLRLNTTDTEASDTNIFNNTAPTSSVFSLGTDADNNGSGATYVAYCFAESIGFSKFGLYEGTNNVNGPFVYLGFRPSVIILKGKGIARNWTTWDDARDIYNPHWNYIYPNLSQAGTNISQGSSGSYAIDFLSNGFKIRNTDDKFNGSGQGYVYMAFGQTLVGSNNQSSNAR